MPLLMASLRLIVPDGLGSSCDTGAHLASVLHSPRPHADAVDTVERSNVADPHRPMHMCAADAAVASCRLWLCSSPCFMAAPGPSGCSFHSFCLQWDAVPMTPVWSVAGSINAVYSRMQAHETAKASQYPTNTYRGIQAVVAGRYNQFQSS